MGRVRVDLVPTPNYGEDGVRRLLDGLRTEGLPVEQEYWLLRESAEADTALAVVLWVGGAVGGGVLGAIGADAWEAFKRLVRRAGELEADGKRPAVSVTISFDEYGKRLLVSGEEVEQVERILDRALPKLISAEPGRDYFYVSERGEWMTHLEYLSWKERDPER